MLSALLLAAWGTFAFGAVYAWAYTPLAVGSAAVGLIGLASGTRPVWTPNRTLLLALAGIGAVALAQIVPLSLTMLSRVSPGTIDFLTAYDFRYAAMAAAPEAEAGTATALAHAISIAPGQTKLFLWLYAAPLVLLLGLLRTLSRTAAMRLATGVVFIGFVLALVGIGQKAVLGDQAFDGMRIYGFWKPESLLTTPFGPYVNKNHFAGWMLMGIPVALGLALSHLGDNAHRLRGDARSLLVWLSEPDGGRLMLYVVAALFMALSLLMTGSRSGLGCFAAVVVGAAVWTGRRGGSWRVSLGAAVAALALVLLALQWAGRDAALERFTMGSNNSLGLRLDIWRTSALIVRAFPVLGTGMNTFGLATYQHQPAGRDVHYNEAHNEYVQLLVEGGAVTFVLALVAIAAVARAIQLRFRANDDGPEAYWVRVGATAGLAAIALQSLVEFSLQMPGNTVLFVLLLAMALYTPAQLRRDNVSGDPGHVGLR